MCKGYTIGCRVYGGVTGDRQSVLKDREGNVMHFDSYDEARLALPESRTTERGVCFEYWINEPYRSVL